MLRLNVPIAKSSRQRLRRVFNPCIEAFIDKEARLAAEAADKAIRSGHAIGPLHGIPVALKDLVELEGRVATGGSAVWRDRRSAITATLAQKLLNAGMIVIGKTHTVEFAFGGWGTNQHLGAPWNPWDANVHHTPGGSVRVPASWCGITGLKTTIGRVSTYGVLPLSPTLDTPGPLTRDAEDAALLLQAMHGADPRDPRTLALRDVEAMPTLRRGVKGLRLGRIPAAERPSAKREVLAAYDRTLDQLAGMGAEIVDLTLPHSFHEYGSASGRIIAAESYALLSRIVDNTALPIDEAVRPRIRAGASISAREYLETLAERERLKLEFSAATESVDALLAPVTATPAIPLAEVDQKTTPAIFTRWVNFLDLCGLAVPNGATASGLPLGLQIVCRGGEEAMALRIGWAWQSATDWHMRIPPMAQQHHNSGTG